MWETAPALRAALAGRRQTLRDLATHAHVVGAIGAGKSTFLANRLVEMAGRGHGVCYITPHGAGEVLAVIPEHRVQDVIYLDPASDRPLGLNMLKLYTASSVERHVVADQTVGLFAVLFERSMGDNIIDRLYGGTLAVLDALEAPTFYDLYRFLTDEGFRGECLERCKAPAVAEIFTKEGPSLDRAAAKVRRSVTNEVVLAALCQRQGLDLARIVADRKILICDLDQAKLGELTSSFLAQIIVAKLQIIATARSTKAPPYHLLFDEFQRYASSSIKILVEEGRKRNMPLCLAHQRAGQLSDDMQDCLALVGSCYYFRQTAKDAKAAEDDFPKDWVKAHPGLFIRLPQYHVAARELVRDVPRYHSFKTPPPPPPTGRAQEIMDASRRGPTREEIVREVVARVEPAPLDVSGEVRHVAGR